MQCVKVGYRRLRLAGTILCVAAAATLAAPVWSAPRPGPLPGFISHPLLVRAIALESTSPFEKWNAMLRRAAEPADILSRDAAARWQQLMAGIRALPAAARLNAVNEMFNAMPYRPDAAVWGRTDYWATPVEFISQGGGDCEDYAIAKYFALRALGLRADQVYLLNYRDPKFGAHMVLVVQTDQGITVMDNLRRTLMPLEFYAPAKPLYALNEIGAWWLTRTP